MNTLYALSGNRMTRIVMHSAKSSLLVLLCAAAAWGAQPRKAAQNGAQSVMSSTAPRVLVQTVVNNELNAHDTESFMYRDWRQTPDGSKTKEMIETRDGVVARLIAVNNQPLSLQQKSAENDRLQNLLSHPELQQQKKKEQEEDEARVQRMFKELPAAFLYQYDGVQPGKSGELIRLRFQPDPNFRPASRETSVFKAMSGYMWVSAADMRLAKIEATLFRDVTFGWGILGHLDKGGHFIVEQTKVAPNRWESTDMNIQFTGKVLFFKTLNMRQIEKLSDFRHVPDGLTLAQGIQLLNRNGNQLAENMGSGR
jgi:hypothetical protein